MPFAAFRLPCVAPFSDCLSFRQSMQYLALRLVAGLGQRSHVFIEISVELIGDVVADNPLLPT